MEPVSQGGLRLTRRRWIDPTPVLDHEVSQPRDIPYPPEQLAEMMNMSVELQQAQLSDYEMRMRKAVNLRQFRHGGSGEPTAERFWLGQYNEVLVDSEHYRSSLPRSIAGVFYVAGGGGETCAIKAHEFLTAHYRLKPEQLLLLMHKPGESPAFEEHGRPQGAPSRTQHPSSGSESIPLAGFPRTTATPSTSSASASTSAHSSESRGGGGGGGHSEAWRRKHAQPPADDSMLKGQFASVESQSSLPERRPQPDDRRPITAQAVALALAAPTPPEAVALAAGPGLASRGASSAVHAPSAPASAPSSTIAELEGMFDAAPAAPHANSHANLLRPSRQDYWGPSAPTIALDLGDHAPTVQAVRLVAPGAPSAPTMELDLGELAPAVHAVRLAAAAPAAPSQQQQQQQQQQAAAPSAPTLDVLQGEIDPPNFRWAKPAAQAQLKAVRLSAAPAAPSAPTLDVLRDVLDDVASDAWLEDAASVKLDLDKLHVAPDVQDVAPDVDVDAAPTVELDLASRAAPAAAAAPDAAAAPSVAAAPSAPTISEMEMEMDLDLDEP